MDGVEIMATGMGMMVITMGMAAATAMVTAEEATEAETHSILMVEVTLAVADITSSFKFIKE
jgi:hypothetical protein